MRCANSFSVYYNRNEICESSVKRPKIIFYLLVVSPCGSSATLPIGYWWAPVLEKQSNSTYGLISKKKKKEKQKTKKKKVVLDVLGMYHDKT